MRRLLAAAEQADPDPWRNQLREAVRTGAASEQMVWSAPVEELSAATLGQLAEVAHAAKLYSSAVAVLRRAQQRYPADFRINIALGDAINRKESRPVEEALGFFRVAVALHPESPNAHVHLGNALRGFWRAEEAETEYREALRLAPNYNAHMNLGATFQTMGGKRDEVEKEYREGVRLRPDEAEAHISLARTLANQTKFMEAEREYHEAIRLNPNKSSYHFSYGTMLQHEDRLDAAAAEFREGIRNEPDNKVYSSLCCASLAQVLLKRPGIQPEEVKEAVELAKRASELGSVGFEAPFALGVAEYRAGDYQASVEALHKSLDRGGTELSPGICYFFLAMAHWRLGQREEAGRSYDKGVEWMKKRGAKNEDLRRFRAEAAALLGIKGQTPPK